MLLELAGRLRSVAARGALQHFYLAPTLLQTPLSHREILDAWLSWSRQPSMRRQPLHLYLHIPFCAHKCRYCIYHSRGDYDPAELEAYLGRLGSEIDAYEEFGATRPCDTFYLGGGTPTVLSESQIEALLERVFSRFRFRPGGERAFECNPLSLTPGKARRFARWGLNRASFGVQTLRRSTLADCNRGYQTERMVRRSIETLRAERFFVNADLIHGLDGGSLPQLARTARRLLDWGATQITVYALSPYTPAGVGRDRALPMEPIGRALARRPELEGMQILAHPTALGITRTAPLDDRLAEEGARAGRWVMYSDTSSEPFSLLGLGPSARGSIFGRMRYQFLPYAAAAPFVAAERLAVGRRLEPGEEQRRYVVGRLEDEGVLCAKRYRQVFGESLRRRFGSEIRTLRRAGWLERGPEGYRFCARDPVERFAAALVFVSAKMRRAAGMRATGASVRDRPGRGERGERILEPGRHLRLSDGRGAALEVELVAAAGRPVFFSCAGLGFFVCGDDIRPGPRETRLLERFCRIFERAARSAGGDLDELERRLRSDSAQGPMPG
jgi:oxygen-independent coproporphyrinogen-3 oxidase